MPQDNFNPEKEPTPERKWWNVFERQTEFEQPEKEKPTEKQIERSKELKSAAKQRGHFWESFMPSREESQDAEEIAPKGEKVRKKWRALLRHKSEKQVEEFKQEDPETVDSYWLAQLMVAERILVLHEQLAQSQPKTNERRQIKTELDVLGLLSEKLSDPEVEVPAEIEDTYRVIVTVLEQGDQDIKVEELPVIKDTKKDTPEQPEPSRERSFKKYGAAVIIALKQAVRSKKPQPEEQPQPLPNTQRSPGGGTTTPGGSPSVTPNIAPAPTDHIPAPHQTPNVAPGLLLTSKVILAEYSDRKDEKQAQEHAREPEQTTYTPNHITKAPTPETPLTPLEELLSVPTPAVVDVPAATLERAVPTSSRKFEHMRTEELLQLAQSVALGNGEYLARAYQSGKIDRDGLISILKTAARKGNYREEFRRKSAEYIRQRSQPTPVVPYPVVVPKEPTAVSEQKADTAVAAAQSTAPSAQTPKQRIPLTQTKPLFSVKTVTLICILLVAIVLIVLL